MHATSRCETSKKTPKVNAWKNTPRGRRKKFKSDNFLFFDFLLFFTFYFFFTVFHFFSVSDMDSSPLSSLPLNTRFPVINEVYRNVKCDKCIAIVVYGLMFFSLFYVLSFRYDFQPIFVDRFWFSVFFIFLLYFFRPITVSTPPEEKIQQPKRSFYRVGQALCSECTLDCWSIKIPSKRPKQQKIQKKMYALNRGASIMIRKWPRDC